jgi:hypothetical protein
MSRRGSVTVECSINGCHAERVITARYVRYESVDYLLNREGWRVSPPYQDDVCPQCVAEGKAVVYAR